MWGVSLWEALSVVAQKWLFPTALFLFDHSLLVFILFVTIVANNKLGLVRLSRSGCGSKPMAPLWGRRIRHPFLEPFLLVGLASSLGAKTGILTFDSWPK